MQLKKRATGELILQLVKRKSVTLYNQAEGREKAEKDDRINYNKF